MSPQDLGEGGQKPEVKHLNASGWIKVSLIMDSGTAKSAAHIGCECVAHRTSTRPPLADHHGSAFWGASAFYFHCQSRRVGISGFHCGGELCCLAPCAQHDVIMRAYHARTANALVNRVSTQHLDTARELLYLLDEALAETQHTRATCVTGKCYEPHMPTPLSLRDLDAGLTTVDGGGGDEHPHSAAHASSDDHHLSVLVRE